MVLGDSPETMRKLCISTKFPHQEIRWNFGILRSEYNWLRFKTVLVLHVKIMKMKYKMVIHFLKVLPQIL